METLHKGFHCRVQLAVAGIFERLYRFWQNNRNMDRVYTVRCPTGTPD